jgi:hypothetical protein
VTAHGRRGKVATSLTNGVVMQSADHCESWTSTPAERHNGIPLRRHRGIPAPRQSNIAAELGENIPATTGVLQSGAVQ